MEIILSNNYFCQRYLCNCDYSKCLTPLELTYSRDLGERLNGVTRNELFRK